MRRIETEEEASVRMFRPLRGVSPDVNFQRFIKRVERLKRQLSGDRDLRVQRMQNRRRARTATPA